MVTKWTKEKRMKVQRMFERGHTREEVAKEMDVTKSTLAYMCRAYFIKFPVQKRTPRVTYKKVCLKCGKKFTRTVAASNPEPKYCNRKCSVDSRRKK
jgi:orotate phosphoribosyltransferase-like protein